MLLLIILLPLIVGTTLVWHLEKISRKLMAAFAVGLAGCCFAILASFIPDIIHHNIIKEFYVWLPSVGINLDFRLDALSLMFAMLISGIGMLIFTYAYFYLGEKNSLAKLYSLLMLFMAAMLGISLSNNLMILLVFWELTSISSFLLVGYWQNYQAAQRGARMALTVTGLGGLALLAGFVLLGQVAGSYQIDVILSQVAQIQASPLFIPIMLFILLGALTKSAQFPFHFWLPNAMAAPTPVSAYLHSATMVKAGIFLLLRLSPLFFGVAIFHHIVLYVGLITLTMGAFFAIFKEDLKGLLAYSTISHLGLIMALIGLGSPLAIAAAIFHILNHASFKAALFMIAGVIDHETGTRDLRKLGGIWQLLPITGTLTMITAAAMAGVPLTNGFLSKEMFFTELFAHYTGWSLVVVAVVATLAGLCAVMYSIRLVHGVFFDRLFAKALPKQHIHEPVKMMLAPVMLLALVCISVGVAPAFFVEQIIRDVTIATTLQPLAGFHIALWHGVNLPLLMSVIALLGGAIAYVVLARDGRLRTIDLDPLLGAWRGHLIFEQILKKIWLTGRAVRQKTETSQLTQYIFVTLLFCIAMVCLSLGGQSIAQGERMLITAPWLAVVVWGLLILSCVALLRLQHQRGQAVLISGAIGLVVTVLFFAMSAPDLALTQITVDVVTTILLLLALAFLPSSDAKPTEQPHSSKQFIFGKNVVLSVIMGLGLGCLTWWVLTRDHQSISWFFLQQSLPLGGGSNVVNVILVDFRGFDTFGEITVLGIAAIGVLNMMHDMRRYGQPLQQWSSPQSLLLKMVMAWLFPIALLLSVYIFWRGHNLPGGGFIAGLITALALIGQYLSLGQYQAEQLLNAKAGRKYERWIGIGLLIAGMTAVFAWGWGRPFLTSANVHLHFPMPFAQWFGEIHLASAASFDLGVYITVVGATMLLISVLADSRQHHSKQKQHITSNVNHTDSAIQGE